MSEILWRPCGQRIERSLLEGFARSTPVGAGDYQALWEWSTTQLDEFWAAVWRECRVVASQGYDEVVRDPRMPGARWFSGARLNFAENLLSRLGPDDVALIGVREGADDEHVTGDELRARVARAQQALSSLGVDEGDRVAGVVPNSVETVVMTLAASSLGAVWSSCSPDFGPMAVVDRLGQIRPKVLVAVDGYRYGGRRFPLGDRIDAVLQQVPSIEHVVAFDHLGEGLHVDRRPVVAYEQIMAASSNEPTFAALPFDHPLYVMYSSGTTGRPKCIVHGAGGTLVQHLKEHQLHCDVHPGDRVFWFTTCGWMMWNWLVSVLASGATAVVYDGSPAAPDLTTLWRMAERTGVTHFGTSPRFLRANMLAGVVPADAAELSSLRAVMSTGAPLQPEQFDWVYDNVASDVHLASISGGTDILGCFVLGVPTLPVRRGRIQARGLGMAVDAFDETARSVREERGELVCTRPFPSMPLGFWDDPGDVAYRDAYFSTFPGVWTHGDFVEILTTGEVVIHGRSDTTLNPGGVRIGTAEIYRAVEQIPRVVDAIVVGRPTGDDVEVVLFVELNETDTLDDELEASIRSTIRTSASPRHVPARILQVLGVPYTMSGKKVEKAVLTCILGDEIDNVDAIANPQVLDEYRGLRFD